MHHRLLSTALAAFVGFVPYHAQALDCQNATRPDDKAICRDLGLKFAEEKRATLSERLLAVLPSDDRTTFSAYEMGWMNARAAHCLSRNGDMDKACLRDEIDDRIAELEALKARGGDATGPLRFRSRRKKETNPNVDIHALYVEFEAPRTAAERLFNDQVAQLVNRLPFSDIVNVRSTNTWQDTVDIRSIYRSPRLVGARFSTWVCCGVHGSGGTYTVNVDLATGTTFAPAQWFYLDEVATACWHQFLDGEKGGESFRRLYPLRDSIDRFGDSLRSPSVWSFSRRGADLQFASLMGHANGPFTCRLGYGQLAKATLPGIEVPP